MERLVEVSVPQHVPAEDVEGRLRPLPQGPALDLGVGLRRDEEPVLLVALGRERRGGDGGQELGSGAIHT